MGDALGDVKGKLGFGCLRLPKKEEEVDIEEMNRMVDLFLSSGFNYFDTAHGYISGRSETAIRESLVKRYPRESYILTDKLTDSYFKSEADIRPFFNLQLERCGVDYFDYYLMHAQNKNTFQYFKERRAYEVALELRREGRLKHFGISFHDKADVLDSILSEYPEIEVVQLQFNYMDYEDQGVQSRRCYEVCEKYNKPIIVMEPVKGGKLVNLPNDAKAIFDNLNNGMSYASYAIRFAAGFPQIRLVLSGMSNTSQMEDNLSYMRDFKPLSASERAAVDKVIELLRSIGTIPCTACRYCVDGCPRHISIPDLFSCMNSKLIFKDWNSEWYYNIYTKDKGKASDCIRCGKCERICPQHLEIIRLLEDVAKAFDKKE